MTMKKRIQSRLNPSNEIIVENFDAYGASVEIELATDRKMNITINHDTVPVLMRREVKP